jgi:SAM-dependent methyltransferase
MNTYRLERLLPILACPVNKSPLRLENNLLKSESGREYPIVDGSPYFIEDATQAVRQTYISHKLSPGAEALIADTDGFVLNLRAGGTEQKPENVVELEYGLCANTDIAADAHCLPFLNDSFSSVISLNAFEHYRKPDAVVSEIMRVLKPGGKVYILTAFLQPIHMEPHHYFNATPYGLEQWFSGFSVE